LKKDTKNIKEEICLVKELEKNNSFGYLRIEKENLAVQFSARFKYKILYSGLI
jgi:hypothetical protein